MFQLIHNKHKPSLQSHSLLPTLNIITTLHLLSKNNTKQLQITYLFLQHLKNLLQNINNKQTQTLPSNKLNHTQLT